MGWKKAHQLQWFDSLFFLLHSSISPITALSLQLFFPLSRSSVVLRPCSPFILFAFFFLAIVSLCFYGLCNFTDFPVFRVSQEFKNSSRIELVQKFLATVMSLSKLPLDCDELVRKILRTLMKPSKFPRQFDESSSSHCSVQPISIVRLEKPSEFFPPGRRAIEHRL